jgi:drug/metabolite transporter (DMT)-like permease
MLDKQRLLPAGYTFAFITISLWSLSAFFSTRLSRLSPFLLVGISFIVAGLMGIWQIRSWKLSFKVYLVGVGGLFGYQVLYFMAFQHAPAVEVNLVNYLWPLFIVLLSPVYLKGHPLRWNHLLGTLAGLVGAGLVVSGGSFHVDLHATPGYAYAFMAAIIWASYSLLIKRYQPLPPSAANAFCLVSGLLALGIYLVMRHDLQGAFQLTAAEWWFVILIGIGPHGIAFVTWNLALKNGDPRRIASLTYLIPLFSTLVLLLTRSGTLGWITGLGMLLILVGVAVGSRQNPPSSGSQANLETSQTPTPQAKA